VAVIVDDGIATGATARAACQVVRRLGASQVILAAPVAPADTVRTFPEADAVVCVSAPDRFVAVGAHYRDFAPTGEQQVIALLDAADQRMRREALARQRTDCVDAEVQIPLGTVTLEGHLHLPDQPRGIVLFAHGSGSSRHSPRNRFVAAILQQAGLGTLLLDLLTGSEERDRANVFDIGLLAARLTAATRWLAERSDTTGAAIGYFGASTGAAAALWAAAEPESQVLAVVSRGGRPDLARQRLGSVRAATLLIVGSADPAVLDLNRRAQARLRCPSRLEVVAGASHLFEEPGTLGQAALLAKDWFCAHLLRPPVPPVVGASR